jgi:RNA polymerase sigma-70 factor, ECF subfamily
VTVAARNEDDERLLVEAAKADPARFADLYEIHFERVYAFVVGRVRMRQDAEDLTAEVFRKALQDLPRFEWRGAPFAAWLLRIAANAIADRWQRVAREPGELPPDPADETAAEVIERRALLFQLVDALPHDQRQVVIARFVEQKSIRDIAQDLSRSPGAVKQLQFRALQSLRARVHPMNKSRTTAGRRDRA